MKPSEREVFGTLKVGEPHPAFTSALDYLIDLGLDGWCQWREVFASCALSDNRLAEICLGTLDRLLAGEPVSDRYLLGLAWTLREMELKKKPKSRARRKR